jgi:dTDP-4-dehydrorhamnose 3,5-epimerase-like enzyme
MADFLPVWKRTLHSDTRGDLFEILRFTDENVPGGGYMYSITIAPGARRGDHYHERKIEWMTCVAGEITLLAETTDGTQQKLTMRADSPVCVRFDTGVAHAFLNTGTTTAVGVFYGSEQHDPEHPDAVTKIIELREE